VRHKKGNSGGMKPMALVPNTTVLEELQKLKAELQESL
jgi:hypothetical protein